MLHTAYGCPNKYRLGAFILPLWPLRLHYIFPRHDFRGKKNVFINVCPDSRYMCEISRKNSARYTGAQSACTVCAILVRF
jgi:hypothetical protein